MSTDAPFVSAVMTVRPEWIDYNGHLNMAYYNVLFDKGVDEAFAVFGMGPEYVATYGASFFTLEAHVTYLREIHEADPVRVTFQLLDYDARRTHYVQQLVHATKGFVSATSEQMSLHVDLTAKRAAPYPPEVLDHIRAMHDAHARLPRPPQVGHVIGIPRKSVPV